MRSRRVLPARRSDFWSRTPTRSWPGRRWRRSMREYPLGPDRQPRRDRRPHHQGGQGARTAHGAGLQPGGCEVARRQACRRGDRDWTAGGEEILSERRCDTCRGRRGGSRCRSSRLWIPVRKWRLRRRGRGSRHDLRRTLRRRHPPSWRQGRGTAGRGNDVPTVPGSDGRVLDLIEARAIVSKIGFPVMIKAAAGGGGRGIRIAQDFDEFDRQFPQAAAEATAAFGDGGLYLEKVIEKARHVEVQILGDGTNFVHCFERECSLQRRRQKVWEEAPAVGLPAGVREKLCASAVALARSVGYQGAGTVEYLYDEATKAFYFIEVNTRIQVEHPVTEMVTGLDRVQEMLRKG